MPREDRSEEFSLVQGGPLCSVFCRCGLMRSPEDLVGRRIVALIVIAWLPLVALTAMAGELVGGVTVPFVQHLAVHARLLGALPLLLAAEVIVHQRITILVRQFNAQGLIPPEAASRFDEIVQSSRRIARWNVPEVILALLAVTLGHWLWSRHVAMPVDTWYGRPTEQGLSLTAAGKWFAFVSLPIFRFLLYRWYFRLAIWYRLLWKVSRLPLNLNPAHPDRVSGLGFLGQSVVAFAPILAAHTLSLSGVIGDQIWHRGLELTHFKIELGLALGLLLLLVLTPLFFFAARVSRARRAALREHSIFAARYVDEFTRKWIRPSEAPPQSPLGNPDIQSLADLGTYYQSVQESRVVPIGKKALMQVAILMVLPILPLLLTIMPFEEMITRLAKLVV